MNLVKELRDPERVRVLAQKIKEIAGRDVALMEVCGTHTVAIFRYGIRSILPDSIKLISGPGCPVCVTSSKAVDEAVEAAQRSNVILATFGDMIRVPGSSSSLEKAQAAGAHIRVVSSPLHAVDLARECPDKEVVFFAVGFETTSPGVAASILTAEKSGIKNFSILCCHKVVPPTLRVLFSGGGKVDGLICPGHVSSIIGSKAFEFIPRELGIPAVITGFEPLDILQGVFMLLRQINQDRPEIEIQYKRGVTPEGNVHALKLLYQVFEPCSDYWRGFGVIDQSGLRLRSCYRMFDAREKLHIQLPEVPEPKGCCCGEVLRGAITPRECVLFKKECNPENPIGPCMVSSEGTCAAYFKYGW
jgi:hydrogenase expression/formation protein HypD